MKRIILASLAILLVIALTPINGLVAYGADSQKIYGIERETGKIYEIDPDTATITEYFQTSVVPTSEVSPNGLAYDYDNGRLYYVTYGGYGELYFTDGLSQTYAGPLSSEIAAASFFDGKYYYIAGGPLGATDDLHEVVLDGTTGMVVSDTKVDDITGDAHAWTFEGDIAISSGGVIYGQGLCAEDSSYEFFSVDRDGSNWALINSTYEHSLQLAFGADGTLYGHNAYAGDSFTVNTADGSLILLSTSEAMFTDLASVITTTMCARTIGYWKTHPEEWTGWVPEAGSIFDGVSQETLLAYLPGRGAEAAGMNPLERLRAQLLAAELNVWKFGSMFNYQSWSCGGDDINAIIAAAESFLDSNPTWPSNKQAQKEFKQTWESELELKDCLESFNEMGDSCWD